MENWTDHLREVTRMSEDDKRLLAAASVFQHEAHRPSRYLAVDPQEYLHAHQPIPRDQERLSVASVRPSPVAALVAPLRNAASPEIHRGKADS
jgi:hypothetical protein